MVDEVTRGIGMALAVSSTEKLSFVVESGADVHIAPAHQLEQLGVVKKPVKTSVTDASGRDLGVTAVYSVPVKIQTVKGDWQQVWLQVLGATGVKRCLLSTGLLAKSGFTTVISSRHTEIRPESGVQQSGAPGAARETSSTQW